jgi:hypothetical protein
MTLGPSAIPARTLFDICEREEGYFHRMLEGNSYCVLGMHQPTKCPMQRQTPDHNGLYPCLNPRWVKLETYAMYGGSQVPQ